MRLRNLIDTGALQAMSYRHFSARERHTWMYLLQMHLSFREIDRRLGRHHTTMSQEVKRNGRQLGVIGMNRRIDGWSCADAIPGTPADDLTNNV
jgi:hypothetical protein